MDEERSIITAKAQETYAKVYYAQSEEQKYNIIKQALIYQYNSGLVYVQTYLEALGVDQSILDFITDAIQLQDE